MVHKILSKLTETLSEKRGKMGWDKERQTHQIHVTRAVLDFLEEMQTQERRDETLSFFVVIMMAVRALLDRDSYPSVRPPRHKGLDYPIGSGSRIL